MATSGLQKQKSITQRLVDKDTWTNFVIGFNDAFTARHKRRPRKKNKEDKEKDDKMDCFDLADEPDSLEKEDKNDKEDEREDDDEDPFGVNTEKKARKSAPEKLEADKDESVELSAAEKRAKYKPRRSMLEPHASRSILMHYDIQSEYGVEKEEMVEVKNMHGVSLWCFKKDNGFRKMCWIVCTNKWFDNTILFLIIVSTLTLAVETPFDDPNG